MASSPLSSVVSLDVCPPAGPYSPAIKAGGLVWVSGQLPIDSNGVVVTESICAMTAQSICNIKAILEAAGSELGKVTRVGVSFAIDSPSGERKRETWKRHRELTTMWYLSKKVFLSDMKYFAEMNAEYEK
ncbi:hypothetical protein Z517_03004 [Fonsecaea pedrosoi CBS 271.37]|uniref:Unplaced genomic scaffold supercont1.2, whole genome shotgun sequence n=1 Tax=Fonsecaea pedrosoi CBS 271.37 TaxID=1442368 RepID=A0A0D2GRZ8_9EURO|nr:uncharacterized protein Z517_03004 [Fonsecaea pedrosoi CBS 271.37]KIW83758.1 hypothetical protein Z517_03004 [Fonsecaea pedrosoi CBS 271.37]